MYIVVKIFDGILIAQQNPNNRKLNYDRQIKIASTRFYRNA